MRFCVQLHTQPIPMHTSLVTTICYRFTQASPELIFKKVPVLYFAIWSKCAGNPPPRTMLQNKIKLSISSKFIAFCGESKKKGITVYNSNFQKFPNQGLMSNIAPPNKTMSKFLVTTLILFKKCLKSKEICS